MNSYSIAKHTILPLVFKIFHRNQFLYLIKDPHTKSLLVFNPPFNIQQFMPHIQNIQKQTECSLRHVFFNSHPQNFPQLGINDFYSPKNLKELQPLIIGQLSICLISAHGYKPDYNLIAVTHMTESSTKVPVVFPGKLVKVCSIDHESEVSSQQYLKSLQKIQYFPSQTYVFPQWRATKKDLLFAKALQKDNQFIAEKQSILQKHKQKEDVLIPTTILQQKMLNPFFNSSKYAGTTDKVKAFTVLRKLRENWMKQQL